MKRVQHRISGRCGVLVSTSLSYASVIFDGDKYPSTVALDSIRPDNMPVED